MIYVARITSGPLAGVFKVGFTTRPAKRAEDLADVFKGDVSIVALLDGTRTEEFDLHARLAPARHIHKRDRELYRDVAPFSSWLASLPADARERAAKAAAIDDEYFGAACGRRLKALRVARGVSLTDASNRAGVRPSTWATWEGGAIPSYIAANRAARAIGASPEDIWPTDEQKIPDALRELLAETREGQDIVTHSDDILGDARVYAETLRRDARKLREDGESIINDALRVERRLAAIEAALSEVSQ